MFAKRFKELIEMRNGSQASLRVSWLAIVVLLAACAPNYARPGPAIGLPRLSQESLITRDGAALPLRVWNSPAPNAVVIALHGFNDYSKCFTQAAEFWAQNGVTTFAYDQRGFGGSAVFGRWPGRDAFIRDLEDAVAAVRSLHPDRPLFVLGESMGGAVVLAWQAKTGAPGVQGLVLVAPAVWGWSTLNPLYQLTLWTTAHLTPGKTVTGARLNRWPSDNIPMLKDLSRDPKVIKATRIDTIYGLVGLMDLGFESASEPVPSPAPPVLTLYGAKDQIVPAKPVRAVSGALGSRGRFAYYPNGYHMLLRDLEAPLVWTDVLAFLEDPAKPLPSGLEAPPKP